LSDDEVLADMEGKMFHEGCTCAGDEREA
jgi:hypothetical protein